MRKIKNKKTAAYSRPAKVLAAALGLALLALVVWVAPAAAEHTRFWRQSNFDEFDSGTAHGVAIRSDGRIVLAPKFTQFIDPNLAYLWSLRIDSKGNLYAAGGTNAKVLKIDSTGKMTTAFESEELTAQAVTLDKNDNLYVATSPDGKVYKVTANGQKSVFFDPKMKYIWDLALGPDGTVYVATGDTGKIFSVTPDGRGSEFYTSTETHIRALALDGKGNLLAGTEPDGLVLRIPLAADPPAAAQKRDNAKANAAKQEAAATEATADNTRNAFVIYETAKKEITALLPDNSGNLYVGAIGEKTRGPQTLVFPQAQQPNATQAAPAPQPGQTATITITAGAPGQPQASPFLPFPNLMSSSVYRIAPDGSPEELWTSRDASVYTLGFGADGKLLMGVGNEGSVMQLDQNRVFSRLAKTASEQVTGFARAANGKVYVATSNPANVFTLGPDLETEGSLESQTFDAKMFSHWGHVTWWGQSASGTDSGVELYVRTGNTSDPADSWSQWSGPYHDAKGEQIQSPAARFVQWKAVLKGAKTSPEVSWIDIGYLPKNAAPYIEAIAIQDPGVKLNSFGQNQAGTPQVQVHMPPAGGQTGNQQRQTGETPRFEAPPQGAAQKGWQSVIWSASDPNDDDMTYSIYYHGEKDKDWKLLKDKIEQKFYTWDTTSMPDGAYYLKIVASDERSNPPSEALKADRESDRFIVDNTPPSITGLAADPQAGGATVRFRAADPVSAIVNAQYSVDAGDWTLLHPVGDVADSPDQRFEFALRNLAPGEHTVAVRANDQFENLAAAQVTFTVAGAKK